MEERRLASGLNLYMYEYMLAVSWQNSYSVVALGRYGQGTRNSPIDRVFKSINKKQ